VGRLSVLLGPTPYIKPPRVAFTLQALLVVLVMTGLSSPRLFRVEFAQEEVERMRRLLVDTRLPTTPQIPGATWDYGVDLDWLKSMRDAWLSEYDWCAVERRMNVFNHFKVTIEGIELHYLHHKSERDGAIPIILTHGWPGPHVFASSILHLLQTTKWP